MTHGDPCPIIRVLIIEISKRKFRKSYQHDFYSFWGFGFYLRKRFKLPRKKNAKPEIIQIF